MSASCRAAVAAAAARSLFALLGPRTPKKPEILQSLVVPAMMTRSVITEVRSHRGDFGIVVVCATEASPASSKTRRLTPCGRRSSP